ncbi:MAG: rhomboid family intramembrane serine protease [Candidatus Odinarchaeum yellowstonii]|uniref:Rhomboid family intramembrane serine protease n=1 Tax=Odinarchaeota yellowstonii (strain LCB_4) TaxID=1841599 RepID=A0AAF0D2Y1_ODILC|nr:MAG: rhomboid family intramembrane serine protease [Candidatus Odinarchaeum yellowstonii]
MFYTPITSKTNPPYATLGIIAINVLIYFIQSSSPAAYNYFVLNFGLIPYEIVSGVNLQTLITSMFVHGSFVHIFFNMYILLIFGPAVEKKYGPALFLVFYVFCGVLAGLIHSYITFTFMPLEAYTITIGASGAIFGVMAAYAVNYPNQYLLLFFFTPVKAYVAITLFFILETVLGFAGLFGATSSIAHFAHVGGFIAGVIFALLFRRFTRRGPKIKKERDIEVIYL